MSRKVCGFPSHDALRVDWAIEGTDKSGTIPAEKFTSDATLITIAADALAELASEEYDGKTVVFTVRGNFASAKIAATLKVPEPEPVYEDPSNGVKIMKVVPESGEKLVAGETWRIEGEGLRRFAEGDTDGGIDHANWSMGSGGSSVTLTYAADGRSGAMALEDPSMVGSGEHDIAIGIATNGPGGEKTGRFTLKVTGAE